MSFRVIGYDKDGHRITVDEGSNTARVQGHGGTSAGFWTGTVVVPPPRVKLPRQPLSVTRPKV